MKIRKRSWMAWWYGEWERRGGCAPERENLCHFVRVLTVYAPLRVLFCTRPYRRGGVPLILPILGAVGASWLYAAAVTLAMEFWVAVMFVGAIVLGLAAFVATLIGAVVGVEKIAATQTVEVATAWFHAKTSRFCPFVEVEHD